MKFINALLAGLLFSIKGKKMVFYKDIFPYTAKHLLAGSLLCLSLHSIGQDLHFSQFNQNAVFFNPAFAGSMRQIDAGMQYRSQWKSVDAPFVTYGISGSARLTNARNASGIFAAGLVLQNDKSGDGTLSQFQLAVPLAYHIKLNDNNLLGAGVYAGFGQSSASTSDFTWSAQYDGTQYNAALSSNESEWSQSFNYFDVGAGISWVYTTSNKNLSSSDAVRNQLGISVKHLNQPRYSYQNNADEKLGMNIIIYEQLWYGIPNSRIDLVPSVLVQIQNKQREIMIGGLVKYRLQDESLYTGFVKGSAISIGLHSRLKDAMVAQMMLEYDKFCIGFSYDFNTSSLRTASNLNGGFELCLKFVNPSPFGNSKGSRMF
jgi:type IX secretion system PorP/SprF family membrane protein